MLEAYRQHAAERAALGISPLPLSAKQTEELIGRRAILGEHRIVYFRDALMLEHVVEHSLLVG